MNHAGTPDRYSTAAFERQRALLARQWHLARVTGAAPPPESDDRWHAAKAGMQPILLRGAEAFSNVCTHRAAILVEAGPTAQLQCPYHGRRFGPDGRLTHAPGCPSLPRHEDLPRLAHARLGPWRMVRAAGGAALPATAHWTDGLPLDRLQFVGSTLYEVRAHWALWVENYLEGLHVPWVHPALRSTLDLGGYETRAEDRLGVQMGRVKEGPELPLAPTHPAGQRVGGLYLYLFPCTTLNFYAWGASVNVVEPLSAGLTRVHYAKWSWAADPAPGGPGGALDEVEREDDAIVERVARGVAALADRGGLLGSYVPGWEDGTRAFHNWLAKEGP